MEGKKQEEERHTTTFTHGAKNCCSGRKKQKRAYLIVKHTEKLIVSQDKICVILNAFFSPRLFIVPPVLLQTLSTLMSLLKAYRKCIQ